MTGRPDRGLRAWLNAPEAPMERQPLLTHLAALRRTLLICGAAILAGFLLVFLLAADALTDFVTGPLRREQIEIIFTGVAEAFGAKTKLSLAAGLVLAAPVVLGALWAFVRPALRRRERVWTAGLLLAALGLFAVGVVFAYRYVFYLAANFFVYSGEGLAQPMISLGTYVGFLFGFVVPFGVMFELPILIIGLTRLGLVTTKGLSRARKYVIFGVFVLAAILTPPDVVSQVLLGLPMCLLYEVGVLCSRLFRPREAPAEDRGNIKERTTSHE